MSFLSGAQFHNLLFYIIGLSGTGGGEAILEGGAEREEEYRSSCSNLSHVCRLRELMTEVPAA